MNLKTITKTQKHHENRNTKIEYHHSASETLNSLSRESLKCRLCGVLDLYL